MKQYVVIVAGGSGSRMKTSLPKQFLLLKDQPILAHTLSVFKESLPEAELILVLPQQHFSTWNALQEKHQINIDHTVVAGGETRFHSVKNGLSAISESGIVAVHDAVRPLVSKEVIITAFSEAQEHGSAIPTIGIQDSIRYVDGDSSKHLDRSCYRIIQTPQVFRTHILKEAYLQEYGDFFTDDASVVEKKGFHIHLIEGNKANIKITTPEDLLYASSIIS